MVDAMANSVEDYLIEGLSFKLNPGASYVTDRRSVSFFTAGSNVYQPGSGARVARINLTGDGWLDPSTVRVIYTLVNNDKTANHVLRPLSGPWCFFRRARCLVGSAISDDVDYYNRVHEMLHILTSKNNRDNDDVEGFGDRWDEQDSYGDWNTDNVIGISPGSSRTVSFKPLFGILNQPKYIPISWAPIQMEFEVVNGTEDVIVSPGTGTGATDFNNSNTSTQWQIQDVRIVCDIVTLDSTLQNSYAEIILSGKTLPINYGAYITQFQTLSSVDFAVNVSRACTRLKSVFINFDNKHDITTDNSTLIHKQFNTFASPMTDGDFYGMPYNFTKELQWQIQIGSKNYPEYPVRSMAESFYQLKKALGIHGSAFHSVSITPGQYRNDHFILSIDTEKILEAGFTGLNTRSGDLMIVRGKYANSNSSTDLWANAIYIILQNDQILEIKDTGCMVYD